MKEELKSLDKAIQSGINKEAIWIPLGYNRIGEHIGIGSKIQTIIGGMSGTGKTAFTDLSYVIKPYGWMKRNPDKEVEIRVLYFSMERSKTYKLAKWVCMYLWEKHNILLSVPELLNWGVHESRVSAEIYQSIVTAYDYFNEMLDFVEVQDGTINPTGIYKSVLTYALKVGKIEEKPYITKDGIERTAKTYIPNNPRLITIIILDHVGKLKGELNNGVYLAPQSKALMDKMSDYCGSEFRDFLGFTPVIVSQFNRSLEDTQRRKMGDNSPLPGDFKNTSNLYEDADVALALYNPYKLGDNENLGYNVRNMVSSTGHNKYRSMYILKNSYGVDDIAFGMNFIGEIGMMYELPKPNEMNELIYQQIKENKYGKTN